MNCFLTRSLFYLSSLCACAVISMTTGCASGGFKLTREYARWVNSQNIILRIIIYILTFVVFTVTILIDAVVFNTMDFWQGRVSAGSYDFKDADKTYHVQHEVIPETQLKRSTVTIKSSSEPPKIIVLNETSKGEVELFIDGQLRTRVNDISSFPIASIYNENGSLVEETALLFTLPVAAAKFLARN